MTSGEEDSRATLASAKNVTPANILDFLDENEDFDYSLLPESPEDRLALARHYATMHHNKIMDSQHALLTPGPNSPFIAPTAPSSSVSSVSGLAIFNRIYIGSVQFDITEADIREAFRIYGPIKSLAMMMDAVEKRHRGYGFIEFEVPEAAALALHCMHNTVFGQRHIKCGRPNNFPGDLPPSVPRPPPSRLYVANVHEMIGEADLQAVFAAFGPVKACRLQPDFDSRLHRGYGYVEFEEAGPAAVAHQALHRFDLAGNPLQVGKCVIGGPLIGGMALLKESRVKMPAHREHLIPTAVLKAVEKINTQLAVLSEPGKNVSAIFQEKKLREDPSASSSIELPSSLLKHAVMKDHPTAVRIANLEDPQALLDNQQHLRELQQDVREECERFGPILDMNVVVFKSTTTPPNDDGADLAGELVCCAFVKFMSETGARECARVMDGRWFGGRRLTASLFPMDLYDSAQWK